MKRLMLLAMLIGVMSLGVYQVPAPLHAQDDPSLSEEEIALVERFVEIVATEDAAPAYGFYVGETTDIQLNLTIDGENSFYQNHRENVFSGTLVKTEDFENQKGSISSEIRNVSPESTAEFTLYFDVVFLDDVLYAQVTSASEEAPEYVEGWQMYSTADDLPEAFSDTFLPSFFDDSDSPFDDAEFLLGVVASATTEDFEGFEVIELTLAPDKYDEFFMRSSGDEENPFAQILAQGAGEGEITLKLTRNIEDESFFVDLLMSYAFEDVAAEESGMTGLPEGALVDFNVGLVSSNWLTNFISADEIEPIVAPDLTTVEATEESE